MSALAERLQRTIRACGPLTLAQFMAEALSHPRHGYYAGAAARDPLGAAGDYVTAPEISQMFGELIGLWCAELWRRMGGPVPVRLVELGPGRGTLMADALRAAAGVGDFRAALEVHLVETSPTLRALQERRFAGAGVTWHASLAEVPEGPMLLVANELFDALPVHQFVATEAGWRERLVGLTDDGERFALRCAPGPTPALTILERLGVAPAPGTVAEICPAAITLAREIAARLAGRGGAALIIDYGRLGPCGASVQAVRGHRRHDPLADPGEADLSAHVDFAALARSAREAGAAVYGPVPQGAFLCALGIETRAAMLKRRASARQAAEIDRALARLTEAERMGALFKALAIADPALGAPVGFDER
jgi:NADH dehydrogenase [ubiquinone] 1 alpha subcomplex assembly factor 7